jgi:tetratricopeptide (TPR) repeat protein
MSVKQKNANVKKTAVSSVATPFLCSYGAALLAQGLIALATIIAYSNTLSVPFIFDDEMAIKENATIRRLWPIGKMLVPPGNGAAVQRRPVANVTLAINYAVSGLNVWSYHALNITAHLLAAFLLFGVVRRTLLLPQYEAEWSMAATPLAFAIAFLWAVHPLLTEAVTYIVQRTEVLAGLFYLLTLYCVIRGATGNFSKLWSRLWYTLAVVACALAMGSKEAALSAPVVVLLYDRIFLSPSWRETFRRRWALYLGLAATWSVILIMLPYGKEGTKVFGSDSEPVIQYALAQCGVIAHYLRLCFWPHPLVVDYGTYSQQTMWQIAPYVFLMLVLLTATAWAFRRQAWLGFLGVCFFAILAPSSSIIPLPQQIAAEKRMYLPLAAVITSVVIGIFLLGRRFAQHGPMTRTAAQKAALGLVLLTGCILCITAFQRNNTYGSALTLWQNAVDEMPKNARAYGNLGSVYANLNQADKAIQCYQKSLQLDPNCATAWKNFGSFFANYGQEKEAIPYFEKAVEIAPDNPLIHCNLGRALTLQGRYREAESHYREALKFGPDFVEAYNYLVMLLSSCPDGSIRNGQQAVVLAQQAVQLSNGQDPISFDALASAYAETGQFQEAVPNLRKAMDLAAHQNKRNMVELYARKIQLFQTGKPFRLPPPQETLSQSQH